MVKKLQEELIANISLILTDSSETSGESALKLIKQLENNINEIIFFGTTCGTALDYVIMADSLGDPSKKQRINNRTLLELEKAITDIGGQTLEELEPTQKNIKYTHGRIAVVYVDRAILNIILDIFLQIRRERETLLRVADENNHIHNHNNTESEVTRATLDSPSMDVENVTTQQHTRERQSTPSSPG